MVNKLWMCLFLHRGQAHKQICFFIGEGHITNMCVFVKNDDLSDFDINYLKTDSFTGVFVLEL